MEQPRTRTPQSPQRRRPPLSAHGSVAETAGTYRVPGRPVPPVLRTRLRLPNPRLTGIGAGLFAIASMLAIAFLDDLLFDGDPTTYGVMFLLVSAVTAIWVRSADLVTAPIGVPIAFAAGSVLIAGGPGGFAGTFLAVVTTLAMHAGWLYGGTLIAGIVASVRKIRQMGRRQLARDTAARLTGSKRLGATAIGSAGNGSPKGSGSTRARGAGNGAAGHGRPPGTPRTVRRG